MERPVTKPARPQITSLGELDARDLAEVALPDAAVLPFSCSTPRVGFIMGEDQEKKLKVSRWEVWDFLLGTRKGHVIGLTIVFLVLIWSGVLCWMATGGNETYDTTLEQSLWFSWGMFFDPGTQMGFAADSAVKFKITAVIFSILGFTFNLLILGLIVELARVGLDSLHKHRNRLVENGHSLVLGWSEKTLFLLEEMRAARRNRGMNGRIVILADEEEAVMWAEIRRHFPKASDRWSVICRRGSPHECNDLAKASAKSAREIVILGTKRRARESDLDTIRSVVALAALPETPSGSIITEVRSPESAAVIRSVLDGAEGILAREPVNRVLALMALNPIVGDCFVSLVSFLHGEEFYCKHQRDMSPEVQGSRTFGEASRALKNGICVGVNPPDELTIIAPDDDYILSSEDRIVVLAHSEADLTGNGSAFSLPFSRTTDSLDTNTLKTRTSKLDDQHDLVIVGWNLEMMERLLMFNEYAVKGTRVHILSSISEREREVRLETSNSGAVLNNMTLVHYIGSTTSVRNLARLPLQRAIAILVLADVRDTDAAESDAACLGCAVTLNRLCKGMYDQYPNCQSSSRIICEVVDPRTERVLSKRSKLAETAKFFHSNALETGIFVMASNDPAVFNTLLILLHDNNRRNFGSNPGNIVAEPLENYLHKEDGGHIDPGNFWTLWDTVRAHGEILLGWHHTQTNETVLNPQKADHTRLCMGDKVIVARKCGGLDTHNF